MTTEPLELELQRMVDGELSPIRMRSLLQVAESQPGLWRELALAFVEQQVLQREATAFARGERPALGSEAGAAGTGSEMAKAPIGKQRMVPARESGNPSRKRETLNARWLAAAAAIWLMLPIGYWLGLQQVVKPSGTSAVATMAPRESDSRDGADMVPRLPHASLDLTQRSIAPYRMHLVSDDGQPLTDKEIPLIPWTLAREMGIKLPRLSIPDDVQTEYRQAGYQLQPRVRWMRGKMNDGREVLVPLQDLTLVAYGQ